MEKLGTKGIETKYENLLKAYNSFYEIITYHEESKKNFAKNPVQKKALDSSVIKHFEMLYETLWKFLKEYIDSVHGLVVSSPKEVFRASARLELFSHQLVEELIELSNVRNLTTHTYDPELADVVSRDILKHYKSFEKAMDLIKKFPG